MSLTHTASAIGSLSDPTRRGIYEYVAAQREPVSRDDVSAALNVPLTRAKFHLERLAEERLLETEYRRLTGRRGPGAGRPSKLYRRSSDEFFISIPERRYDLMGGILAAAVESAQAGADLDASIASAALSHGREAAAAVRDAVDPRLRPHTTRAPDDTDTTATDTTDTDTAEATLNALGFEAEIDGDRVRLRNCPFHALAARHTRLVCTTNVDFVEGILDAAGCQSLRAALDPAPGYCCVVAEPRHRSVQTDHP